MAITRAQQAKQMLQDGGMLVQPGFGGTRQGYRGSDMGKERGPETGREPGPVGGGKGVSGDNRDRRRTEQYKEVPKETIKSGKDFRDKQKVEEAFTKETIFDKFPSTIGLLSKFSKFDPKFMKDFAKFKSNQDLLDYINSLTEEQQSSGKLASALNLIGYGDFLAEQKGLPGLKYAGDVGGLEQFIKEDGTFGYSRASGEGGQPIIPTNVATSLPSPKIIEPSPFNILPARITGSIFDFSNMAEDGRIQAMDGGIMDLESARQMMFLGGIAKSIGKGLKSVTRAAKKVFKSPVGKAALLGLGAYYAPGFGIKATGGFPNFAEPGGFLSTLLTKGGDKALTLDNLSGLKLAGLLTAAPFLFSSSDDKDDVPPTNLGPVLTREQMLAIRSNPFRTLTPRIVGTEFAANGGRIGYQEGSKEPVAKKTMPLLDMDGKEMDLREEGGFVPIGRMEKADDVPARLSKNEFVFTADAVRNAGDGDVDKGAEVMYNMMKNLEAGGEVSEESQGLKGARQMFQTSQRLEEVL